MFIPEEKLSEMYGILKSIPHRQVEEMQRQVKSESDRPRIGPDTLVEQGGAVYLPLNTFTLFNTLV